MAEVPTLSITLLGAGQEVGRSCCVLQYRDRTIVLDAGVHPAYSGMASLPFVDELDWSTVDAILITQFVQKPFLHFMRIRLLNVRRS
jgi:cleavage and polyadenylation specificity factor subunit 3